MLRSAIVASTFVLASSAYAAQPVAGEYVLPSTRVWDMTPDTGKNYRIMVSYPAAEPPEKGFPVLYVLDGNASFATFAETRRVQEFTHIGQSIVVGVGYRTNMMWDAQRNSDFIVMDNPPPGSGLGRRKGKNGRDEFLEFLTGKLRAELGKNYKIDPARQALFGHSFGGLFALHALYSRPEAFHSIIVASPSLELDGGVLRDEREFVRRLEAGEIGRTSRLMIVAGARDIDDDPVPARALAERFERLSGYGLRVRFKSYEDEGHLTVPARAVPDVLRFAFEIR